jgi:hypothetical protein
MFSIGIWALAFEIASLVDVADRGKSTLSGIAECKFCFCGL